MVRSVSRYLVLVALLGLGVLELGGGFLSRGLVWSQETKSATKKASNGAKSNAKSEATDESSADDAKAVEKPKSRGRLPMFYSRVVDNTQRDAIYAIQKKFETRIAEVMAELKELEGQRDTEIFAVLTKEQQEQIASMTEELKKRREAARGGGGKTAETEDPNQEEPTQDK